jgi:hypothetical protein
MRERGVDARGAGEAARCGRGEEGSDAGEERRGAMRERRWGRRVAMRERGGEERCGKKEALDAYPTVGIKRVTWKHQEAENCSSGDDLYRYIGF